MKVNGVFYYIKLSNIHKSRLLILFLCCHCLEFIDGDLLRCVCVDRGPGAVCGGGSARERFRCGRFNPEQVSNLIFLFPISYSHTSCHVCVCLNDVTQCDVLQQHLTLVLPPEATSPNKYCVCVCYSKDGL